MLPGKWQVTAGDSPRPMSLRVLCLCLSVWAQGRASTETALRAAVSGAEDAGLFSFLRVLFVIFIVNMNALIITVKF